MRALLIEPRRRVSRVVHKKRRRVLILSALLASMALFFFTLLVFLSHRDGFLIRDVTISGNALVPKTELSARVDTLIKDSYLHLFPKRNYFLFPKGPIKNELLETFPALETVSVERSSFTTAMVNVRERVPFALYCKGLDSDCFFVDKEGLVFAMSPAISSDVYLRFVGPLASTSPIGTRVFPPERFREFSYFIQSLRDVDLSPRSIIIERGTAGVPDFSILLGSGTKLLISGAISLEQVLANITAFFSDPEVANARPAFVERALYIDFRFENKVFYKLRE